MKKSFLIIFCQLLFFGSMSQIGYGQTNTAPISIGKDLQIIPLSEQVYIHKSWTVFTGFGRVASNGLIYTNEKEVVLMDTPANDSLTRLLVNWIEQDLGHTIKAVIINHHHTDCLGGLKTLHEQYIPSYATKRCQKLARKNGVIIPQNGFRKTLNLPVGNQSVLGKYFGKAHTADNLVVYIPSEKILFGGCMVKSLKSGKGNLADASVKKWSKTVLSVKNAFPQVKIVVPGHGPAGDTALLDYTIDMFKRE